MKIRKFFSEKDGIEIALNKNNPRVFLYGLSETSKTIFHKLWSKGYTPEGIVASPEEIKSIGQCFMGRKIISIDEYKVIDNALLLAPFGEEAEQAKEFGLEAKQVFSKPYGHFLVYGAGKWGQLLASKARILGIELVAFVDNDTFKQGTFLDSYPIISTDDMHKVLIEKKAKLLVALEKDANAVAEKLCSELGLQEAFVYNHNERPDADYGFHLDNEPNGSIDIFDRGIIFYLRYLTELGKKIILWGNRRAAEYVKERLEDVGIHIAYLVTVRPDGDWAYDCTELAYEDSNQSLVLILRQSLEEAMAFCSKSGLPEDMFYWNLNGGQPHPLSRIECLDPAVGLSQRYKNEVSVLHPRLLNHESKRRQWKIGVLGGSTSVLGYSPERSWPEQLEELAYHQGIFLDVAVGTVAAQAVGQEMIRFVRDMANDGLDMLISFSGINEGGTLPRSGGYMISQWQDNVYLFFASNAKKIPYTLFEPKIFYGHGLDNYPEHWFFCERIMYSICKEFGIEFRAVLHPVAEDKRLTKEEQEAALNFEVSSAEWKERKRRIDAIRKYAFERKEQNPWIVDGTKIFSNIEETVYLDVCHVNSQGNRIIAEWMLNLIKETLGL